MSIALRDDVYFCVADQTVVLLDLRLDRYHALAGKAADAFLQWLKSSPADQTPNAELAPLLSAGLMKTSVDPSQEPQPLTTLPVRRSAMDQACRRVPYFTPVVAAWYYYWADAALRRGGLKPSLDRLRLKKQKSAARALTTDGDRCLQLAQAFSAYRALVTTQDRCLARSIALTQFLNRHGQFPELVIAVKTKPFAAHAWVQWADMVLNDELDHVLPFTPIFVV